MFPGITSNVRKVDTPDRAWSSLLSVIYLHSIIPRIDNNTIQNFQKKIRDYRRQVFPLFIFFTFPKLFFFLPFYREWRTRYVEASSCTFQYFSILYYHFFFPFLFAPRIEYSSTYRTGYIHVQTSSEMRVCATKISIRCIAFSPHTHTHTQNWR